MTEKTPDIPNSKENEYSSESDVSPPVKVSYDTLSPRTKYSQTRSNNLPADTLSNVREKLGLARVQHKIEDLVGVSLTFQSLRGWKGRFGECYTINFLMNDTPSFCVTSATVVVQKLLEVEQLLPLQATIIKEVEYFDIV